MTTSDVTGGVWERVTGEPWSWSWSTTDDTSGWADLEVVVRAGADPSDRLIASTETGGGISTVGTDFGAGRMVWTVAADVTAGLVARTYWLHVRATIAGSPVTVLLRELVVRAGLVVS